jgi:hypothetical protein
MDAENQQAIMNRLQTRATNLNSSSSRYNPIQ